jgi:hypothetical protein
VIDWRQAIHAYVYGIQKFCLKQQSFLPTESSRAMIRKNDFGYFEDFKWAFFNGSPILYQDLDQIRKDTLSNKILQNQIYN